MPFWAFYMIACGALILWGWRVDDWKGPALILAGLLGVRLTPYAPELVERLFSIQLDPDIHKTVHALASCTVWVVVTALALVHTNYLVTLLLGISTIVYLPLIVVGFRIERLGFLPIASDLFLILAIMACGGGILSKHLRGDTHSDRFPRDVGSYSLGVAESKTGNPEVIWKD